jgi:hypothetical protein
MALVAGPSEAMKIRAGEGPEHSKHPALLRYSEASSGPHTVVVGLMFWLTVGVAEPISPSSLISYRRFVLADPAHGTAHLLNYNVSVWCGN